MTHAVTCMSYAQGEQGDTGDRGGIGPVGVKVCTFGTCGTHVCVVVLV